MRRSAFRRLRLPARATAPQRRQLLAETAAAVVAAAESAAAATAAAAVGPSTVAVAATIPVAIAAFPETVGTCRRVV